MSLRVEVTARILSAAQRDPSVIVEESHRIGVPYLRDDAPDQVAAAVVEVNKLLDQAREGIASQVTDLVRQYHDGHGQ